MDHTSYSVTSASTTRVGKLLLAVYVFLSLFAAIAVMATSFAETPPVSELTTSHSVELRKTMVDGAIKYLRTAQGEDGSFSSQIGIGPTALILTGLVRNGAPLDDPLVEKALQVILKSVREDGGVYSDGGMLQNYETCIVITCLAAILESHEKMEGKDVAAIGSYQTILKKAEKFIRNEQFTETRNTSVDDPFYGGAGYGQHQRPDLSNTQFFLDALKSAGAKEDDPAIQKALVFVSRCQNLESEYNTLPFAAKNPDGGFIYSAADQSSKAENSGDLPDGALRSYGSMTYAGFKSLIYAGLTPTDKRYKAAMSWLQKHYTLTENPGIGQQGVFYYYHTMAKTLAVLGTETFETASGETHHWKTDMVMMLTEKQLPSGAWLNSRQDRWMEADPNLVTGYVLLILAEIQ